MTENVSYDMQFGEDAMSWQPIGTAPKDGTPVMLYRDGWGLGVVRSDPAPPTDQTEDVTMPGPEDDPADDITAEEYYRGMVESERFVCTKENPWTPEKGNRAEHPDAVSGEYCASYTCPNCGKHFYVELPQ